MTLLEILAAIFILGMGLIMVAGAFPVGEDQAARSVRLTESAQLGRSAIEMSTAQRYIRNMIPTYYAAVYTGTSHGLTRVRGKVNEPWRVWNPQRWAYAEKIPQHGAYVEMMDESAMWPPQQGDYIWRPFVTRLSNLDEAPLFRLTAVVAQYKFTRNIYTTAGDLFWGWELFNPDPVATNDQDTDVSIYSASAGLLMKRANSATGRTVTMTATTRGGQIKPGDYLMDPRTGIAYLIEQVDRIGVNDVLTVGSDPIPAFPTSTFDFIHLRNVVGVYYSLLSQ